MTTDRALSPYASAVYEVLVATATRDNEGRLISTEPLYRFLLDRFGIPDPQSRRVRTAAVRELTEAGLVQRLALRGPRVELLRAGEHPDAPSQHALAIGDSDVIAAEEIDGEAPSYEEYAAAVDGDLDGPVEGRRRIEQAFLRNYLLAGRTVAPCGFCGSALPKDLLVAAHLKRRADLSRDERLRFADVAGLACTLGCDSLYEHGYLGVDDDGRLLVSPTDVPALDARLEALRGRAAAMPAGPAREYLAEHRARRFRGVQAG